MTDKTDTISDWPTADHVTGILLQRHFLCYVQSIMGSHTRTVVRECCKGDDESQWERGKFDPRHPKKPLTDGHQNLCR